MGHCAVPLESATAEQPLMAVEVAVKLTVPVGEAPVTVAVNVTVWLIVEGLALDVSMVVVAGGLTTCLSVPLPPE